MALTLPASADPTARVPGSRRDESVTLTLDSSYPTGGYTVAAALVGMTVIHNVLVGVTSTGKPVFWTGSKLKVFSAVGTEVSSTTDLSAETVVVYVRGI